MILLIKEVANTLPPNIMLLTTHCTYEIMFIMSLRVAVMTRGNFNTMIVQKLSMQMFLGLTLLLVTHFSEHLGRVGLCSGVS